MKLASTFSVLAIISASAVAFAAADPAPHPNPEPQVLPVVGVANVRGRDWQTVS
ncbi:hypothetical protein EDC05_001052 [Coemansia umbellata]|uniref:Uncharacterized protein n=1 Tax=Coemansia umbellata TaxID=1424467 RepID=A0ABQ8PTA3_9FUNG|nr:hypothetical protein EDC05_001052 [Coemansia umbellata]